MEITQSVPLDKLTTLSVGGLAQYFTVVHSEEDVQNAVKFAKEQALPVFVLGGGSNVLINDTGFSGLVIKNEIGGFSHEEREGEVLLTVGAGEVWDAVVAHAVANEWWGIENLSAIPGSAGATPIQNVGAYGTEVKDVITTVTAFDTQTSQTVEFTNVQCKFGYRHSIFKDSPGRYVILRVTYKLSQSANPNLEYKDLHAYFSEVTNPSIAEIRDAVISIRSKKFPDWNKIGTAGSFFKNPTVTADQYSDLQKAYPELPGFPDGNGSVKLPLGWILDKVLHKKGFREGDVGSYEGQALVLVNFGGATAEEIATYAQSVIDEVQDTCGVTVVPEVTYVN